MNLKEANTRIKPIVKIVIGLVLLGCFISLPYWYFMVVRWVCSFGLLMLFTRYKRHLFRIAMIPFIILFSPFADYELSKGVWLIFDVLLAIVLIIWAVLDYTLGTTD